MFSHRFNRRSFFKRSGTCCLVVAGSKLVSISGDVEAIHSFQLGHLAGLVHPDQDFALGWYVRYAGLAVIKTCAPSCNSRFSMTLTILEYSL